jgi:hypothetical protein
MQVLRNTVPDAEILQQAFNTLLTGERMPGNCTEAFDEMTDDCICPDLSWVLETEIDDGSDDEEDDDEEDDEEDEDDDDDDDDDDDVVDSEPEPAA